MQIRISAAPVRKDGADVDKAVQWLLNFSILATTAV